MRVEVVLVEVAADERDHRLRGTAGDANRVHESLALLGRLGREPILGQPLEKRARELQRVHELPLRGARMDAVPLDPDADLRGREVLVVDAPDLGAVERVGEVGPVFLEVEMLDAASYFLVDGEADPKGCMLDLGMFREVRNGRHDLGDARLVVGAEKRRPVGRDEIVPDLLGEERTLGGAQHLAPIARQLDVASVVADHLRLHIRARLVRARIHVRDQPDRRAARARERREDVAVLLEDRVFEAEVTELLREHLAEVSLFGGARVRRRLRIRLGVDPDVAEETLEGVVGELGRERRRVAAVLSQAPPGPCTARSPP